jgi:hypothetical protein
MGRLVVEARGTAAEGAASGVAGVGNSDPLYLVVSITDADGAPFSGLVATDFTITAKIVAAYGSKAEIASVGAGQDGDYLLDVVPITYQGTPLVHLDARTVPLLPHRRLRRRPGPDHLRRVRPLGHHPAGRLHAMQSAVVHAAVRRPARHHISPAQGGGRTRGRGAR